MLDWRRSAESRRLRLGHWYPSLTGIVRCCLCSYKLRTPCIAPVSPRYQRVHYTVQCIHITIARPLACLHLESSRNASLSGFLFSFSIARVHLLALPKGIRLKQKLIANIFLLTFPFHKMCSHVCINGRSFSNAVYHAVYHANIAWDRTLLWQSSTRTLSLGTLFY